MLYDDCIYGKTEINEPVILDIINCPSLQRLKDVDQAGFSKPFYPGGRTNRFNHSVGVFILLKKYNASLKEQIAGLIHDISHTVFSHCIDFAFDGTTEEKQSYQDDIFEDFIKKTQIPNISIKYNFNLDYILDDKNFPLKEKELPDLCADRIDYSLRNAIDSDILSHDQINYLLDNLIVENKTWIFKNYQSAKKYKNFFFDLNQNFFNDFLSAVMYRTVGDYVKYALQQNYIIKDDLYTTDTLVLEKINRHLDQDEKLKLLFDRMNRRVGVINNPQNYDARVLCKSRLVDPLFKDNNQIKHISEIDPEWKNILQQELKPKEYFLKFAR